MLKTIVVPSSEMEIVRCPQWDDKFGGECWGLKPKNHNAYYWIGSKDECENEHQNFKIYEEVSL